MKKYGSEANRYREVWDDILEAALEINLLKNIYNVTQLGFLIDTSISRHHNVSEKVTTENIENGKNIFSFEILIALVVAYIINSQNNL
jgi:hypothetical protein